MVDCLTTRFHRCSVIADALATMLAKYENGSSYEGYESTHADTAEFCANAILEALENLDRKIAERNR
jgi:hypothetical protein